jgi:hypothetical protein
MKRPDAGVPPNHVHIHPALAFYSATLEAARALHMEDHIGSFQRGSDADVVVLNPFGSYDTARRTGVIDKTSSSGADGAGHGAASGEASLDYLWKRLFILTTAGHAGGAGGVGVGVGARMGSLTYDRIKRSFLVLEVGIYEYMSMSEILSRI